MNINKTSKVSVMLDNDEVVKILKDHVVSQLVARNMIKTDVSGSIKDPVDYMEIRLEDKYGDVDTTTSFIFELELAEKKE